MNMTAMTSKQDSGPWYREPWPWILMSGPFVVVIAAFASAWIALSTSDGLVADDYYKQGLSVGETIARSDRAAELGLSARMKLTVEGATVSLAASANGQFSLPAAIRVTLSHPTRAGLDQAVVLPLQGTVYGGKLRLPAAGHWLILIEDDVKSWRLMGSVVLPAAGDIVIGGVEAADIRN
jgi:hypothetical protein